MTRKHSSDQTSNALRTTNSSEAKGVLCILHFSAGYVQNVAASGWRLIISWCALGFTPSHQCQDRFCDHTGYVGILIHGLHICTCWTALIGTNHGKSRREHYVWSEFVRVCCLKRLEAQVRPCRILEFLLPYERNTGRSCVLREEA